MVSAFFERNIEQVKDTAARRVAASCALHGALLRQG